MPSPDEITAILVKFESLAAEFPTAAKTMSGDLQEAEKVVHAIYGIHHPGSWHKPAANHGTAVPYLLVATSARLFLLPKKVHKQWGDAGRSILYESVQRISGQKGILSGSVFVTLATEQLELKWTSKFAAEVFADAAIAAMEKAR